MNKGVGKMKDRISLFCLTAGLGNSSPAESNSHTVWADVSLVGVVTQYNAMSVGKKAELSAIIWKNSYRNETHCKISGVNYKIDSVGPAENDLKIKLILVKG